MDETTNTNPSTTSQPTITFNWQAIFQSPLFWGIVIGSIGTLVVQYKWKNRGQPRVRETRREPRIVQPVGED